MLCPRLGGRAGGIHVGLLSVLQQCRATQRDVHDTRSLCAIIIMRAAAGLGGWSKEGGRRRTNGYEVVVRIRNILQSKEVTHNAGRAIRVCGEGCCGEEEETPHVYAPMGLPSLAFRIERCSLHQHISSGHGTGTATARTAHSRARTRKPFYRWRPPIINSPVNSASARRTAGKERDFILACSAIINNIIYCF
jgi:hypothetical protein